MTEDEKELLKGIKQALEDIKAILLLANQEALSSAKKNLLKDGSIEQQVYDLCDGTNTTKDVAEVIGKSSGYVRAVLSKLRQKGLVTTMERDGKKVHCQIL